MNNLTWKILIPLAAGIGATACALAVISFSGIQNIGLLILAASLAGVLGNRIFTWLGNYSRDLQKRLLRPCTGETVFSFLRLPVKGDEAVQAGGKGKSLAHLFQEGFPVPDGCVLLPDSFAGDDLTAEGWSQVQKELSRLRRGRETAFAVRSSALQEDSELASFAGEFESVLNVRSDEEIYAAVKEVLRSRHSERVSSYTRAQQMEEGEHAIAIVIQRMVNPDFAGVLFTVDPLSGNLSQMTGNYVPGLGEKLVSGQVSAQTFTIDRPKGVYNGPEEMRKTAKSLHQIAHGIEDELRGPQDIEWGVHGGKVFILQSRPITTLNAYDPVNAVWNDSRKGHFLWSATNLMEASPNVLTPFTASMLHYLTGKGGPSLIVKNYPLNGIIGGRFYANISVQVSAFMRLFKGDTRRTYREMAGWWGDVPQEVDIPVIPLMGYEWWRDIFPGLIKSIGQFKTYRQKAPAFLAENRQKCAELKEKVQQASSGLELLNLWNGSIFPRYRDSFLYIVAAGSDAQVRLEQELRRLVGAEDANALLSNLGGASTRLESLGPMAGLAEVLSGQITRQEYLDKYGHRGVNEGECAWPRPLEDAGWLDRRLEEWKRSPVDVNAMLARQHAAYEEAWQRFCVRFPGKARSMQKRLSQAAESARLRESVRSEATRGMVVLRAFALRAGELLGLNNDIFYLTIDEVLEALASPVDFAAKKRIPARQEMYKRYCELPPYPALICGRFDPFAWAADPHRRSDVYDAGLKKQENPSVEKEDGRLVCGFAGALGVVEGTVRRLDSMDDSSHFRQGEVLVTSMTNIGWTPLFPRAAAIVTDLGAPLSHAAIVARELGIPAVVGCGNATMRLKTGDRVRVNGGEGLVEILT